MSSPLRDHWFPPFSKSPFEFGKTLLANLGGGGSVVEFGLRGIEITSKADSAAAPSDPSRFASSSPVTLSASVTAASYWSLVITPCSGGDAADQAACRRGRGRPTPRCRTTSGRCAPPCRDQWTASVRHQPDGGTPEAIERQVSRSRPSSESRSRAHRRVGQPGTCSTSRTPEHLGADPGTSRTAGCVASHHPFERLRRRVLLGRTLGCFRLWKTNPCSPQLIRDWLP